MCDKCGELDKKIAHYRQMLLSIGDQITEMSRSLLNIAKRPLPRSTLRGVGLTSKDAVS